MPEIGKVSFHGIKIKAYHEDEDIALAPKVIKIIKRDRLLAEIFYSPTIKGTTNIASLLDYFLHVYNKPLQSNDRQAVSSRTTLTLGDEFGVSLRPGFMSLFEGAPINAGNMAITKVFTFDVLPGGVLIETIKGPKFVKEVEFELGLAVETKEVPLTGRVQYASTDKLITNVVETDIELMNVPLATVYNGVQSLDFLFHRRNLGISGREHVHEFISRQHRFMVGKLVVAKGTRQLANGREPFVFGFVNPGG